MTVAFQTNVLRYLCTSMEGAHFVPLLDASLFDLAEHQIAFDLLSSYHKDYSTLARNSANLLEYFDKQTRKQPVSEEVHKMVSETVRGLYSPFDSDTEIIIESLVEFAQAKQTKLILEKELPNLATDPGVYERITRQMTDVVNLRAELERKATDQCTFIIKDHKQTDAEGYIEPSPTFLKKLNAMTSAGGFYAPQLVVIMGQPKSFKTGTVLALGREYMRDGKKVFYADTENGKKSIRSRVRQGLLNCTLKELRDDNSREDLDLLIPKVALMGGDMAIGFYPAKVSRPEQVEADLDMLKRVHNWVPDIIIWDNPDNFKCNDRKVTDTRLVIQSVYFDIIRINERLGCFSIGISQVNKAAVNKEVINMKDFAEDFAKAMNCHAAFAICRTEMEMAEGVARIVPVVQREGKPQGRVEPCIIQIDEERGQVIEIDLSTAALLFKRSRGMENLA